MICKSHKLIFYSHQNIEDISDVESEVGEDHPTFYLAIIFESKLQSREHPVFLFCSMNSRTATFLLNDEKHSYC